MKPLSAWSLVALQFLLIALLVVLPAGQLWSRGVVTAVIAGVLVALGAVVAFLGGGRLGRVLTPSPIPRGDGHLVTTGIYALVRHPIYTGLLTASGGLATWGASWGHLVTLGLLVGLISIKARVEEKLLFLAYEAYGDYAQRVGRFVPGVGVIGRKQVGE